VPSRITSVRLDRTRTASGSSRLRIMATAAINGFRKAARRGRLMGDSTGESEGAGLRLDFDCFLKLELHGATVTSYAGCSRSGNSMTRLACSTVDDAVGGKPEAQHLLGGHGGASSFASSARRCSPLCTSRPSLKRMRYGFPEVDDLLAIFSMKSLAVATSASCAFHLRRRNSAAVF